MRIILVFERKATGSLVRIEIEREETPVFVEGFNGFEICSSISYPESK